MSRQLLLSTFLGLAGVLLAVFLVYAAAETSVKEIHPRPVHSAVLPPVGG